MRKSKPYSDRAGYIASARTGLERGWIVIYHALYQGIDVNGPYAVVCESHGAIVGASDIKQARASMKDPTSFCHDCRSL